MLIQHYRIFLISKVKQTTNNSIFSTFYLLSVEYILKCTLINHLNLVVYSTEL